MQNIPTTPPLQIQKPSRLPVRSSSLPQDEKEKPTPKPIRALPTPPQPPAPVREPSPELDDDNDEDIEGLEPTQPYLAGEVGRSSPMRYVHGAPLHNVLEEEEE